MKAHQQLAGTAETLAMVERLGMLPDAPLAMPKQRIEAAPGGVLRQLLRLAALPRLSADDRGR